jgi:hypothetical protein
MLRSISAYDPITAAGILARTALSLQDYKRVGTQREIAQRDLEVTGQIISELRTRLGVHSDDNSEETIDKMADILDVESDALAGPVDQQAALLDLSADGNLPSDLFQVEITSDVVKVYEDKFVKERTLIEETVRSPDREQQYGAKGNPAEPAFVSIFMKRFANAYAQRSFWLIVIGRRRGMVLEVGQAWRLYPDMVDLEKVAAPLDALKLFCDKFGYDVQVGNSRARLFVFAEASGTELRVSFDPDGQMHKRKPSGIYEASGNVFWTRYADDRFEISMANCIDVTTYRSAIRKHGW